LAYKGHEVWHQPQGSHQGRPDCRGIDDRALVDRAGDEDDPDARKASSLAMQGYGNAGQGWL